VRDLRLKVLSSFVALMSVLLLSEALFAQQYTAKGLEVGRHTYVYGINDSGAVVGQYGISPYMAFMVTGNGYFGLGTLGGRDAEATAVNNLGQAVGNSSLPGNTVFHAFLWTQSGGMQDLGTLKGSYTSATAINQNGQVVGFSCVGNFLPEHAFLWTQATGMQDLGTLGGSGSEATGINSAGVVVGSAQTPDGNDHAFIWTAESGMQRLVPDETTESSASAINDSGR
jgi:probable HAF family extracellular repeat protein